MKCRSWLGSPAQLLPPRMLPTAVKPSPPQAVGGGDEGVCVPANARVLLRDRAEAGVALAILSLCSFFLGPCGRMQALPRPGDGDGEGYFCGTQPLFFSYSFPFSNAYMPSPLTSKLAFASLIPVFFMLGVRASEVQKCFLADIWTSTLYLNS